MSSFKITKEQKEYLDSLVCQRISDDDENKEFIKNFVNNLNPGIARSLKTGWNTDKKDKLAFYIVKDQSVDVPLFFFSLKCGEVAVPYDLERKKEVQKNAEMLYAAATGHEAEDWAKDVIKKLKDKGIAPKDIEKDFRDRYNLTVAKNLSYYEEVACEGSNIVRTQENHPAIELVHFCAYDNRRGGWYSLFQNPVQKQWKRMGMSSQTIGKVVFWNFVVPVIREVRNLVGCEYLYLFAADNQHFGRLIKYYEELGFELRSDLVVNKPEYDFTCRFMCQPVTALRNRRNEFFREYNNPVDALKNK